MAIAEAGTCAEYFTEVSGRGAMLPEVTLEAINLNGLEWAPTA
jgi:hypothetical protein